MATIPSGSKLVFVDSAVPTRELKSSRSNSKTEVYTIEDIAETVGGGSDYTETIVNISSEQILSIGDTPIELLPAPGEGKYYDIKQILLEYSAGTTTYTFEISDLLRVLGYGVLEATFISDAPFDMVFNPNGSEISPNNTASGQFSFINFPVNLTVLSEVNPTGGNGTLRAKIYHKTITFGA